MNHGRILASLAIGTVLGCASAAKQQESLGSTQERQVTLGTAQREIRVGMSQPEVATSLGSPNIVTKDSDGKETWIYDKVASEASYSTSSSGTGLLLVLFGYGHQSSGAASSTQRTLTVVIKFDQQSRVESMTYHSTKF